MRKLLLISSCFFVAIAGAQDLCSINGALVYTGPGLQIQVNGNVNAESDAIVESNGNWNVSGDVHNAGEFNHSGTFSLSGNWINDGVFTANPASEVSLIGASQLIGGSASTTFGKLILLGTGDKRLAVHTFANTLFLNDRLLLTDSLVMTVQSDLPTAIQRTSGFVLSERNGMLVRQLNAGNDYLFPVGRLSDYRPVVVSGLQSSTNAGVRFANADASAEGLSRAQVDTTICRSNPEYYHLIRGTFPSGTTVQFTVDSAAAVEYPQLAQRSTPAIDSWQLTNSSPAVINAGTATLSSQLSASALHQAFLLVRTRPARPIITGDTAFCRLSSNTEFQIPYSPGLTNDWVIASGVQTAATDSSVFVSWDDASSGLISVTQTDQAGCSSFTGAFSVVLWPLPEAIMSITAPGFPYEDQPFTFVSNSIGAESYLWQIEGNGVYVDSSFVTTFTEPGTYPVVLTVRNSFGCIDTAQSEVQVYEGLQLPNAFSPNGDGINDELLFLNSGIQAYSLSIFDRWGVPVFETNASKLSWDGRMSNGEKAPAGTYFIVLKASSANTTYEKRGSITLFN